MFGDLTQPAISIGLELDPDSERIQGVVSHRGFRRPFVGWLALAAAIEATREEQGAEVESDAQ